MLIVHPAPLQETLPVGSTLVPIIGLSDQTHLTNFSGDKKAWPVYMTVGNILSRTRNSPVKMPVLLLALLPVPPKFTGESARADETQRQINADVLQAVFDLIFAPLQPVAQEGTVMDYSDGKTRLCFPILSAWIADHAKHATLHGISSKACSKCEVSDKDLGEYSRLPYKSRDYTLYAKKASEHESTGTPSIAEYFEQIGLKIGHNVFCGLYLVDPADLHKPDLLHNIYLGLFKHMMEWVEGFLKKHKRQQAFDDVWKTLPPYPRFSVPKKAYREVTQWQGKEMRNLGRCISAVLASALRDPDSSQQLPFKRALQRVSALIDFSLMAQYWSHTPETLSYMEKYLLLFHQTKDVFLEFRPSKATRAEANRQDRELREHMANQHARAPPSHSAAKRRRLADEERRQRIDQRADFIQRENHFNFIKMHYLSHFGSHVRRFGSISMYSTDIGELAHKEQLKEGYRRSNKNDAARQILSDYGRRHALGMKLQTTEELLKGGNVLRTGDVATDIPVSSDYSVHRRVLRGRVNTGNIIDLCRILEIDYSDLLP